MMQTTPDLEVFIIAGPNGAGKTTFAREFLPQEAHCKVFVNADLIAAGLAPFAPETAAFQAGRLMIEQLEQSFQKRHSFALETTLSGRTYLNSIVRWQAAGYRVTLIFLKLSNVQEAVAGFVKGFCKVGTTFLKTSLNAALHQAIGILRRFISPSLMLGLCTTMVGQSLFCWIGMRNESDDVN